jgi:heme/copper-type cytochrome/quinol oxidase subunit 2
MNQNIVRESPVQPLNTQSQGSAPVLWNPEAAGAWSLILNPVFGSSLVLMNWQRLGVKDKIRNAQIWLVVSILVLVTLLFVPPSLRALVSIAYLLVWYFSAAKPQAKYIAERWGKAYPRRSWLWPLLIAFGILFSLFCLAFVMGMAQAVLSQGS